MAIAFNDDNDNNNDDFRYSFEMLKLNWCVAAQQQQKYSEKANSIEFVLTVWKCRRKIMFQKKLWQSCVVKSAQKQINRTEWRIQLNMSSILNIEIYQLFIDLHFRFFVIFQCSWWTLKRWNVFINSFFFNSHSKRYYYEATFDSLHIKQIADYWNNNVCFLGWKFRLQFENKYSFFQHFTFIFEFECFNDAI